MKHYGQYRRGQTCDGVKIHSIFYQCREMIIFDDLDGVVRHSGNVPADALREYHRILNKAHGSLRGAFDSYVNPMLGRSLATAITQPNGVDIGQAFAEVKEFIDANGPIKLYGRMPKKYNVFTDKEEEVVISYPGMPDGLRPMAAEVKRLSKTGRVLLEPEEYSKFSKLLAAEAAAAIANPPIGLVAVATILKAANEYLEQVLRSRIQIIYVGASLGFALLFDLIAAVICLGPLFRVQDKPLLLAIVGATAGAFASVLLRSNKIELNRFVRMYQVVLQSGVRISLGLLFGIFLVAIVRAGFFFQQLAKPDQQNALFLLSVIAGMSERFVPDLLERIAGGATKLTTDSAVAAVLAPISQPNEESSRDDQPRRERAASRPQRPAKRGGKRAK